MSSLLECFENVLVLNRTVLKNYHQPGHPRFLKDYPDINECLNNAVCTGSHVSCINIEGSFVCVCEAGFARPSENFDCADIDECILDENTCSGPFEVCVNEVGNFSCQCESAGFQRATDLADCFDVDECTIDEDPCPGLYDVCVNTVGSFNCTCASTGYERTDETAGMLTLMKFDLWYRILFVKDLKHRFAEQLVHDYVNF